MALEKLGFAFLGGAKDSEIPVPAQPYISVYAGASAGSFVATFLAQGGKIDDLLGAYRDETKEQTELPPLKYRELFYPRLKSAAKSILNFDSFLISMLTRNNIQSPFSTEGVRKYMLKNIIKEDRFDHLRPELYVVTTEVDNFRKVIFGPKTDIDHKKRNYVEYRSDVSISDACSASMAMPPFYHPYKIQVEGKNIDYFDGELREPLSAHIGKDTECDLVICSYTHQPLRMRSESGSIVDKGIQSISIQGLYQSLENQIRKSRSIRKKEKKILNHVHDFFKTHNLDPELRDKLCAEIEDRMAYKSNVDYIYVHPRPSDSEMFYLPHFSLKEKHAERIVRKGFRAGLSAVRGLFPRENEE